MKNSAELRQELEDSGITEEQGCSGVFLAPVISVSMTSAVETACFCMRAGI